jgi:hypothetical protein
VILDIDSSESPVHGNQEQSTYRSLRVGLLSPTFRLQSGGRLPRSETPAGQRPQCGRVGRRAPPHH